ncbi:autotransporter assembly complex protein TamA [Roseovarius atlanticus]|uniref:autotransporter assembly complex protein TamA n=1 Tax=Roseovarius atlanticus TaxID=1641875 RepID=UPI001C9608A1|nr:autotransporter assembly complex family protein [Roseovarius atlanticus]MBY5990336.1 autotransporter assembly complex protein TamA [Roseovarius atlanticus]MBY6126882.1 autotransporter assembly complex protein TamA [Roseovarius atlanticus]MBY6151375.1 autotransporter assembly complex protein TamA [Roseovarius atlanticus]
MLVCLTLGVRAALATEATVQVRGAPQDIAEYLSRSSLTVETADSDDATAQDILAAARADYARMVGALYDAGFYGGVVSIRVDGREASDISPIAGPNRINRVDVIVQPGPPFTFSRAAIGPVAPETELPEGYARGQPAAATVISDAAEAGVTGWREAGHAKVELSGQSITADHRNATLASDIRLSPGPRLRFGDLVITRPSAVRANRIRAIAGLPSGKVFSPEELEDASQRLRRTGAFRSVVLNEAAVPNPDGTLDIQAEVIDAKPRRIGFGAEIASLEGLTLSGFWLHRNLLGGAERFRIEGEVGGIGGDSGGIDYRLSARFERPATFTPDTTAFLEARIEELDEEEYRQTTFEIGGGVSHIFSDELEGELGIAYQYAEIDDDLGSRTNELLLLPAKLTFDNRDDALDATEGVYVGLEATPFLALDAGDPAFRLYADARTYVGFGKNDTIVLAGRTQLGSVTGASLVDVPPDMLFFSGGSNTVRGQSYQSLGVDLGGGNTSGGRSFLAVSGELRARVADNWQVVGFADTGYVGRDSFGDGTGDWHSGAGFGVRYDTGIGPIRFDVATPLDGDAGQDYEFYIGIGQAF